MSEVFLDLMQGSGSYPINLIQVVGFQDVGADDPSAIRSSHLDIDTTKEDVEVTCDGGSVTLFLDGKLRTERSALDGPSSSVPLIESRRAGREVRIVLPFGQSGICGAGFCRVC